MILATPFHPALPVDYEGLALHLRRKGTNAGHALVVLCRREHEDKAFEFGHGLSALFHRQFIHTLPDLSGNGIQVANRFLLAALEFLRSYVPGSGEIPDPALLLFDPTWRPQANRWLDELQADYYLRGARDVMACFEGSDPPVTAGPVVFGRDFVTRCTLLDFLPADTHWRHYLAWEMFNLGVKTDAIGRKEPAFIRPHTPKK
jgi:hypothetical protein